MAATGAEYVTLEQLKDLFTSVVDPLKDTVDTLNAEVSTLEDKVNGMRKIVPVTCADYDQTFVQLKLADGFSSSPVTMSSGDMMLVVNSEDGTYENGSYLLYTGSGKGLTNSNSTWQKAQLTEYKTSASTVNIPDGVAMLNKVTNDISDISFVTAYQLMVKENGENSPVSSIYVSDETIDSMTSIFDKSIVNITAIKSSGVDLGAGQASIAVQAANTNGDTTGAYLNIEKPDNESSNKTLNIVAVNTNLPLEGFTAEDLGNTRKSMISGTDRYILLGLQ